MHPRRRLKTLKLCNLETLKPALSSMRGRVVDDVQLSCYYQKVPRVKSGLHVCGSLLCCATCVAQQVPGKPWLSFEEVRTRSKVATEDALAETSCENLRARLYDVKVGDSREAMQGKADETERLRTCDGVRRGVTVVGD